MSEHDNLAEQRDDRGNTSEAPQQGRPLLCDLAAVGRDQGTHMDIAERQYVIARGDLLLSIEATPVVLLYAPKTEDIVDVDAGLKARVTASCFCKPLSETDEEGTYLVVIQCEHAPPAFRDRRLYLLFRPLARPLTSHRGYYERACDLQR
jgi:hypothetical protein